MPAPGRIDVNMNGAHLVADDLAFNDSPRGPQASWSRGVLEEAYFDAGGDERFILHGGSFDHLDPLGFIEELTVRECAGEIIALYARKEGPGVRLNGARGFFFETDDLLPLQFGVCFGFGVTAVNARLPPFFLRLPGGGKNQPYCQCHRALYFDHTGVPPSRGVRNPPE